MLNFKKLYLLLDSHERRVAGLIVVLISIMALLDMIGVASILPFVAVLTNPSLVETNIILKNMFQISVLFGVKSIQDFLFALGVLVFALLIISLTFKTFTTYVQVRFVNMREYSISKRLVETYLNQPYSWFLSRNSADLGKTILSEVGNIVGQGLKPLMDLIAKGMVAISLIVLLIIADPTLALIVGFSISFSYFLIFYFMRKYLSFIGEKSLKTNEKRFLTISEAFGAIKEIKVAGLEQTYVKSFSDPANIFAKARTSSIVIAQLPRFILEAIAFGGILLIILFFMTKTGSFNSALPIISLYIFAGYRLMPALQNIYASFSQLTFSGPSLDKIYEDMQRINTSSYNRYDDDLISINKEIVLKNIHYNYPNTVIDTLKDITINIPANSTVGFVGATGSGKTTLIDILLGLLQPTKGVLKVDGDNITKTNLRSWQRLIGYVPQHIYLSDDTIRANIAFGEDYLNIDQEAVEKASKIASLHDFITDELADKYNTVIGERGIRLSGGQRQRIGIARALYHNPKVLVLDEATSALDNQTEFEVMNSINDLSKNITIILIAHRLSTLTKCDNIFLLEKGKIKSIGKFEDLINKNYLSTINNK